MSSSRLQRAAQLRPAMTSAAGASMARSNSARRPPSFTAGAHVSKSTVTSTPLPPPTVQIEAAKRLAAFAAVQRYVKPEHKIIGIGSGTTIPYCIEALLKQGVEANAERWFVPTGFQSKELIVRGGLNLGDVDQFPQIDITIDGADEVDHALNAIKGGGACHLREKVLAEAAKTFVIIADARKNSEILGTKWKQGVPIEVAPFAWASVLQKLQKMGCTQPKLRMGKAKAGPVVTDNGNFVIDSPWDEVYMLDPSELLHRIKMLTGVLEVGLFCNMATAAFFGQEDGTVLVRYSDGNSAFGVVKGGMQLESYTDRRRQEKIETVPGIDDSVALE